jgi:hypothetical protein
MKRLSIIGPAACGLAACILASVAAWADVSDNCDDCHASAPVSATHPQLASTSITGCLVCHAAKTGDSLLESVHAKHAGSGLGCDDCHAEPVPERAALERLLEGRED